MAHFTRPPRAELCSSAWAKPCFLLQRLLLGLVETHPVFLKDLQTDPLEDVPLETFLAQSYRKQHSSFPFLRISKCFLLPSPFSRLRTLKLLLPPVNLLLSCTISTSVHLLDVFSVLLLFLDVREDELQPISFSLRLALLAAWWGLFSVWAWLPQQSHSS